MDVKSFFIGFTEPPTLENIQTLAEEIIDDLPEDLLKKTKNLKVTTEDFPDSFIQEQLELETPFDALGVYQSAGPAVLGHLGSNAIKQDVLYLYRRPLLDVWCETGENLTRLINRVILQEIGYHFGYSEDQIEIYEEDMLTDQKQFILAE